MKRLPTTAVQPVRSVAFLRPGPLIIAQRFASWSLKADPAAVKRKKEQEELKKKKQDAMFAAEVAAKAKAEPSPAIGAPSPVSPSTHLSQEALEQQHNEIPHYIELPPLTMNLDREFSSMINERVFADRRWRPTNEECLIRNVVNMLTRAGKKSSDFWVKTLAIKQKLSPEAKKVLTDSKRSLTSFLKELYPTRVEIKNAFEYNEVIRVDKEYEIHEYILRRTGIRPPGVIHDKTVLPMLRHPQPPLTKGELRLRTAIAKAIDSDMEYSIDIIRKFRRKHELSCSTKDDGDEGLTENISNKDNPIVPNFYATFPMDIAIRGVREADWCLRELLEARSYTTTVAKIRTRPNLMEIVADVMAERASFGTRHFTDDQFKQLLARTVAYMQYLLEDDGAKEQLYDDAFVWEYAIATDKMTSYVVQKKKQHHKPNTGFPQRQEG